jgi:light-independent protochlorophyllide reductase subunit B
MMGLEEHLLGMFREDFEFHEGAAASHLGQPAPPATGQPIHVVSPTAQSSPVAQALPSGQSSASAASSSATPVWESEAEKELGKIPFFVRGKARRNTERFAQERGIARISRDTLYEAKAHYGR